MRFSRRSLNKLINRVSLLIGVYLWIAGLLAIFLPHPPWVIGTILGLLFVSTVGIVFITMVVGRLQIADNYRFRVFHRLGFAAVDADAEDVGEKLETRLPSNKRTLAHDLLFRLSQDVCKDRNPSCKLCPVSSYCDYAKNEKLIQA